MDSPADQSNPPTSPGAEPDEPETSQMAAVPAKADVVWPEDPFASDGGPADESDEADAVEPQVTSPAIPAWPEGTPGQPSIPTGHGRNSTDAPLDDDPHTAPIPTQPAIAPWPEKARSEGAVGKTQPPAARADDAAAKTAPPTPATAASEAGGAEATKPPEPKAVEAVKTTPPIAASSTKMSDSVLETKPPAPAAREERAEEAVADDGGAEMYEAEPRSQDPDSAPDLPIVLPVKAEPKAVQAEPMTPVESEAEPQAPPPAPAAEPEWNPDAPTAQPAAASSSTPVLDNPPIPSWAPKIGEPAPDAQGVQWPGSNMPSWAPVGGGKPASEAPPQRIRITESPAPAAASAPPPAPVQPAASAPSPAPASSKPPAPPAAPAGSSPPKPSSSSWEVVPQKVEAAPAFAGPTAEDKSYAEWFAWAKRSGAPASACHAAAQGAFRALSSGQDMNTAVKWATVAMASPPGLVGQSRQLYCAWFSLGNIDLQLPTAQAHVFAGGAIQALESGADSVIAHQMGLAAAGITAR